MTPTRRDERAGCPGGAGEEIVARSVSELNDIDVEEQQLIFDSSMIFLQGFHLVGSVSPVLDTLGSSQSCRSGCDIRYFMLNGTFPDVGVIIFTLFSGRCIYNQVDHSVFYCTSIRCNGSNHYSLCLQRLTK